MEITNRELMGKKFVAECTPAYLLSVREYILNNIAKKIAEEREEHGMFDALERDKEWDEYTDLSLGASGAKHTLVL